MSKSSSFYSPVDEAPVARDELAWVNESSFDPAIVKEAIAISEGRSSSSPTVEHLQALVEFYGTAAQSSLVAPF